MTKAVYDPTSVNANAFDSANHRFLTTVSGGVSRSVRSKLGDIVSLADFGVVADGNGANGGTDIASVLNAIIVAVSSAGGGEIIIPINGTGIYRVANPIQMKSNMTVRVQPGVKLDGTGTSSIMVQFNGANSGVESSPRTTPVGTLCSHMVLPAGEQ